MIYIVILLILQSYNSNMIKSFSVRDIMVMSLKEHTFLKSIF